MSAGAGSEARARLHFTVGTGPRIDEATGQFTLKEELELVKVALLYGDGARLLSPGTSMLLKTHGLEELETAEERREHLVDYFVVRALTDPRGDVAHLFPGLQMLMRTPGQDPERVERLVRSKYRTHTPLSRVTDEGEWARLSMEAWEWPRQMGADGLIEARDSGLLELHEFDADARARWADKTGETSAAKTMEYLSLLSGAISDGTTHPLFDDSAGRIAKMLAEGGTISPSEAQLARGKHAALAADLPRKLPTFEGASVKQVLAVRRELEGPLVRFRGAVSKFSAEIRSAPWDEDFPLEADRVFVQEVSPAVEEIREAVQSNSSLRSLAAKAVRPEALAGFGALFGGLNFAPAAADAAVAGIVTAGTIAVGGTRAVKEWLDEQREVRGKQMYFYYGAGDALGRGGTR